MPHNDELTVSLLKRAWNSGFDACFLTTDTWQLGWRHDDVATGNYAFYRGIGADLGLSDPVFQKILAEHGIDPVKEPERAGALWIDNVWHGRAWSWEKMPWLIKTWKEISGGRPFCLKGIQSVEDAKRAIEVGCDGIVVSNHAGRQVDGAIASLDALENIVAAVGDKTYIMYDSGIRGASDVLKALALGAKFVFVGRLWVWGLSIMGETGVRHVMKSLLADFDILMNVGGFQNIEQIKRDVLGKFYRLLCDISIKVNDADSKNRIVSEGICHDCREIEAVSANKCISTDKNIHDYHHHSVTRSFLPSSCTGPLFSVDNEPSMLALTLSALLLASIQIMNSE